jgi:UDP-2,3-diacylglucosamine hydrolase
VSTLFISDLHLDPVRPAITALFLDFLAGEARRAEALYILGDLFEAWIGDDDPDPHHARVAEGLAALAEGGTPVRFLVGNRDFLLGKDFARRAGMELLVEPLRMELHGVPTLILHGDVLCTDDADYQAFRTMVRNAEWQRDFLGRPLAERRVLAGQARAESRRRGAAKQPEIMDVNTVAAEAAFRAQGVRRLIHGHTHRPAIHRLQVDGRTCERIVLGDWYEQGSLLRVDDSGARLHTLTPNNSSHQAG